MPFFAVLFYKSIIKTFQIADYQIVQDLYYLLARDTRKLEGYQLSQMDVYKDITSGFPDSASGVDDAVGVPKTKWFIAIVNSRAEKSVAEKLSKLGVENYLPIQEELHLWANGKKAKIVKVLIPSKIFIHCTEQQRREIVNLPYIFRFMTNISGARTKDGFRPLAVVPDDEIKQLKFMLGVPDVTVTFSDSFVKGEMVRVVRGPFKGLCGEILQDADSDTHRLYINIDFLGSASVIIDPADIEIIK